MATPEKVNCSEGKKVAESKQIKLLTKQDMQAIAEITGGFFSDLSEVYDFEKGTVFFGRLGKYDHVSLTLREDSPSKDLVMYLKGAGLDKRINGTNLVIFNEGEISVRIEESEEGESSSTLTIKPGEIYYKMSLLSDKKQAKEVRVN